MGCTKLSVASLLCGHHLCIWKKRQGKSSCMHNLHFGWTLVRVRQAGPLPEGASSQPHGQHAPDPCHFLLATAQPLRAVSPTHSSSTTACRSGNREPILSKTNLPAAAASLRRLLSRPSPQSSAAATGTPAPRRVCGWERRAVPASRSTAKRRQRRLGWIESSVLNASRFFCWISHLEKHLCFEPLWQTELWILRLQILGRR